MSPRRPILALALGSVILAGLGLRDWAIDAGRAAAFAADALSGYGLALAAQGPATLTLLPLPRLAFDRARLAAGRDGPTLAEDGRLTLDLDPLALLTGRVTVGGARLDGARLSADAAAWAGPVAAFVRRVRAGVSGRPSRIALRGARLADGAQVRDLDLDLAWPFWGAAADAHAALTWRGVPTRISLSRLRPADIAAGRHTPFVLESEWSGGSLMAEGAAALPADGGAMPDIAGRARFEARALPETLAWLGRDAPLAPLAGAFALDGTFQTAGRSVSWPSLRVGLGGDLMEGAGAASLGPGDAPRLSLQATLAAERLNLAPLLGALVRLFGPEPVPLALAPLTRGDLDLRLSAAAGRIGPVQVADLAASVLVRAASVEVSVNRARVQDGTLKGRLTLTSGTDPAETEMRAQGSLDRVDLGGLLGEVGAWRWVLGPMQGQFALEGSARDSTGLMASIGGRAQLAIDDGAIAGLDLADVVHRNGSIAPGALARRNGRTAFERATIGLRFFEGVGEITDAGLRGAGIGATLRGQVSLPERRLDAQGDLTLRPPAASARGLLFEVSGPWDALTAQAFPRGEATQVSGRPGEILPPGPLKLPSALGVTGAVRAYAP